MYKEHEAFNPPPDDAVLWRYMDFTKFVSLLDRRALFFSAADKLGDSFEGSFSKANEVWRPILYKDRIPEDKLRELALYIRQLRRFTLISCWHENIYESEAMWKLYSREKDGIAIKTDFDSFTKSFTCSENIYIGRVSYVDYETDFIPERFLFSPFLHKRKSFAHEHEVRSISMRHDEGNEVFKKLRDEGLIGVYYEVDLSVLIKEVIVAPFAPDWFLELVKSVTARYNLKVPVVKSAQAGNPTW